MDGQKAVAIVASMNCPPFLLIPELRAWENDIAVTFRYNDTRWYIQRELTDFRNEASLCRWVNDFAERLRVRV